MKRFEIKIKAGTFKKIRTYLHAWGLEVDELSDTQVLQELFFLPEVCDREVGVRSADIRNEVVVKEVKKR